MIHPKHFVELDPLPRALATAEGEVWQLTVDEHNKSNWSKGIRGKPVSIMVACGDDTIAANEVAIRLIRIWNLLRDIDDDMLGDAIVLKRSGVEDICNEVKSGISSVLESVIAWEPGELANEH